MENDNIMMMMANPLFHIITIIALIVIEKINWDNDPIKLVTPKGASSKSNNNLVIAIVSVGLVPTTGIPYLILLNFFNNAKNAKLATILRFICILGLFIALIAIIAFILLFGTCLAIAGGATVMTLFGR